MKKSVDGYVSALQETKAAWARLEVTLEMRRAALDELARALGILNAPGSSAGPQAILITVRAADHSSNTVTWLVQTLQSLLGSSVPCNQGRYDSQTTAVVPGNQKGSTVQAQLTIDFVGSEKVRPACILWVTTEDGEYFQLSGWPTEHDLPYFAPKHVTRSSFEGHLHDLFSVDE